MARLAPEDDHAGLADRHLLAGGTADLDLDGGDEPGTDTLTQLAAEAEDAALAVSGITNSEGATAAWQRSTGALVTSTGFAGVTKRTMSSLHVTVIAGTGLDMQSDGEGRSARHLEDLPAPADIGREAAERTVRRLDPHNSPRPACLWSSNPGRHVPLSVTLPDSSPARRLPVAPAG